MHAALARAPTTRNLMSEIRFVFRLFDSLALLGFGFLVLSSFWGTRTLFGATRTKATTVVCRAPCLHQLDVLPVRLQRDRRVDPQSLTGLDSILTHCSAARKWSGDVDPLGTQTRVKSVTLGLTLVGAVLHRVELDRLRTSK